MTSAARQLAGDVLRAAAHAALYPALWSTELAGLAVRSLPHGSVLYRGAMAAATVLALRAFQAATWLRVRAERYAPVRQ